MKFGVKKIRVPELRDHAVKTTRFCIHSKNMSRLQQQRTFWKQQ